MAVLLTAGMIAGGAMAQSNQTMIYVSAHCDDWQLFMGNEVFKDISSNKDVVIIYLSAGDGGLRTGGSGTVPFYRARELATLASIRVPAFLSTRSTAGDGWFTRTFNARPIYTNKERNVTSYYLRLPDGNPGGGGYSINNNQSLGRLYAGDITTIRAIDNSATYTSWANLRATLQAIYRYHVPANMPFTVSTHEPDWPTNDGSHSDHIHGSRLALEAGQNLGATMRVWLDYIVNTMPANVSRDDFMHKCSMHGALASTLAANNYDPTYDQFHTSFLDRVYFRSYPNGTYPSGVR